MRENSELFIGLDVSKDSHAVAVAEAGWNGEVRYYGRIGADAVSVRRLVRKLDRPNLRLRFCYEAGQPRGLVKFKWGAEWGAVKVSHFVLI